MFTPPKLTALPITAAQIDMELLFLNSGNQQQCLALIMQCITPVRRYHSVMEWFMAA